MSGISCRWVCVVLLVCGATELSAQSFNQPIQASSSGGFSAPDLQVGTNDTVAILFGDGDDLFLASTLFGFGQQLPVAATPQPIGRGRLAVGSSFLLHVVYDELSVEPGAMGLEVLYRNNNGGQFSSAQAITTNDGIDDRNPVVQVNEQGAIDIVWEQQVGAAPAEILAVRNGGATVLIGSGASPALAALGGGVSFIGYVRSGTLFGRTFDGTTVGAEETIATLTAGTGTLDLDVDSAGSVHVAFLDGSAIRYVRRSAAGVYTAPELRDAGPAGNPQIAAGQSGHAALVFAKGGQIRLHELDAGAVWTVSSLTPFLSVAAQPSVSMDSLDYIHVAFVAFGAVFYMNEVPPPTVDFVGSPTSGMLPLSVAFTPSIASVFDTVLWDFGDGSTSTELAPTHLYVEPGPFTVTLTVTGPGGTGNRVRASYVSGSIPANSIKLPRIQLVAGEVGVIHPIFASHPEPIQGFQVGIGYDANILALSELTLQGSITQSLAPEFVDIEYGGSGADSNIVAGIILDTTSPFDFRTFPPSANQMLAGLEYDVVPGLAVGTTTEIRFVDGLGSPPLNTIFSPSLGPSIAPFPLHGRVTIVAPGQVEFLRGDANRTGSIDIADAIAILTFLFAGGAAPTCPDAADVNDDSSVNIGDAIYALSYLFTNGATPPYPFPGAGLDPTLDSLGACQAP
ncbi:MAG: PKD domain-containing protein [Planctomycetota bacterium]